MTVISFDEALRAVHKLAPENLYVHRPLLNAARLHAWAASVGITNLVPPSEMHVTQVYSRKPVNITPRDDKLIVKRHIAALGDKGAVVLHFDSPELQARHQEAMAAGASHDWPSYVSHVTLSYDAGGKDLSQIAAPDFPLVFGPEVHQPLDDDWAGKKGLRKDFDPDEARDQSGKWTDGGGSEHTGPDLAEASDEDVAYERTRAASQGTTYNAGHGPLQGSAFVSPSITDKNFSEASQALSGARQQAFDRASHDIDRQLGLHGQSSDVIGAWADGAENSTMLEVRDASDLETMRTATVMKGALANQKAVLIFATSDDGPDRLYDMEVPGDAATAHADLLKAGIGNHTLIPNGNGTATRVIVVDTDGSLRQGVGKFAETHNTAALAWPGHAEFIGDTRPDGEKGDDAEQRSYAQGVYQKVIDSAPPGDRGRTAGEVWKDIRDKWAAPIQALKRSAMGFLDALAAARQGAKY